MNKTTLIILISIITLLCVSEKATSQSCGVYRIIYIGNVSYDESEITSVSLPTPSFLQGELGKNPKIGFVNSKIRQNKILDIALSPITSCLFNDGKDYLAFYRKHHDKFPITFTTSESETINVELDWENIEITKVQDSKSNYLFEINLGTVKL